MPQNQYIGLNDAQVAQSRAENGANVLTPAKQASLWKQFLGKFKDPLIIILLVAAIASIAISCWEYWGLGESGSVFFEPTGIVIAILLATGIGFILEMKANKEFAILNKVNDDEPVEVIRSGSATTIPRKDVVVGDIVILNTGGEIPADGELLEAVTLSVDESTLTGEPIAHKTTDEAEFDAEATFPSNCVLRGTKVMEGHGVMRVSAVGDATENGKVFTATRIDDSVKTPLTEQFERLGKLISRLAYVFAAIIIVARVALFFSANASFESTDFVAYLLQTIMIAVALICVTVPEGLPMAVTMSLAYSMRRMLKTNNLVRKLHACETMGATTVICTDKTGTLTQNQMQVYKMNVYGNVSEKVLYESIAANTTALLDNSTDKPSVLGNPTEGALLLWLRSKGVDYAPLRDACERVDELPFTTERKYMATIVRNAEGRRVIYVKGAPEIIYSLCADKSGVSKEQVDAQLLEYQNQAMRTLGFAYQEVADDEEVIADNRVVAKKLKFIGVVAISDPVRADVPAAVKEVLDAGVQIKIVTGDTPGTAKEIGRQVGLWHDEEDGDKNIIIGVDFEALSDEELRRRIDDFKIIARARPMDKKRLVETLQEKGEVVAVTGDGTNDAPALKAAQVGLSMGDGTSVAKEASDITIVDNSFASIGRAVMWGRSLFQNIRRFVLFQMTVNVVACLIVLCGTFLGTDSPLTVTQMLWVNLIMDTLAAMALSSLPPSQSVMKDKPRSRKEFIINHSMWKSIITVGGLFFVILLAFLYYLQNVNLTSLTQIGSLPFVDTPDLTPYELSIFFTFFVLLQFWNLFNSRAFASHRSAFTFAGCSMFWLIAGVILVGQVFIITCGGQFFSVVPIKPLDWAILIGVSSLVLVIGELVRLVFPAQKLSVQHS